jgi:hypothetical protein
MNRPEQSRGSPLQPTQLASTPNDLAERYRELQRLRRRVEELERLAGVVPTETNEERRG